MTRLFQFYILINNSLLTQKPSAITKIILPINYFRYLYFYNDLDESFLLFQVIPHYVHGTLAL